MSVIRYMTVGRAVGKSTAPSPPIHVLHFDEPPMATAAQLDEHRRGQLLRGMLWRGHRWLGGPLETTTRVIPMVVTLALGEPLLPARSAGDLTANEPTDTE